MTSAVSLRKKGTCADTVYEMNKALFFSTRAPAFIEKLYCLTSILDNLNVLESPLFALT